MRQVEIDARGCNGGRARQENNATTHRSPRVGHLEVVRPSTAGCPSRCEARASRVIRRGDRENFRGSNLLIEFRPQLFSSLAGSVERTYRTRTVFVSSFIARTRPSFAFLFSFVCDAIRVSPACVARRSSNVPELLGRSPERTDAGAALPQERVPRAQSGSRSSSTSGVG